MSPHKLFFVLLALVPYSLYAQFQQDSILKRYKYASLRNVNGTDILVWKKNDQPKPTIIFIQGSGFTPLFINGSFIGIPFNFYSCLDKYNMVVATKPGVPAFDDSLQNPYLNMDYTSGFYRDKSGKIPLAFTQNNNRDHYKATYLAIIDFLQQQPWAQKNKLILMGHSQGAHVAAVVAPKSNAVDRVVLMSPGSPAGRFYEFIQQVRIDEIYGMIDHKTAQAKVDSIYALHLDLIRHKDDDVKKFDSSGSYHAYYSFNHPALKDLIPELKQKTLVIYGTGSIQDRDCDNLRLQLDEAGNTNVRVMAYPAYDHNYFEDILNDDGSVKERLFHWDEVAADVIKWLSGS